MSGAPPPRLAEPPVDVHIHPRRVTLRRYGGTVNDPAAAEAVFVGLAKQLMQKGGTAEDLRVHPAYLRAIRGASLSVAEPATPAIASSSSSTAKLPQVSAVPTALARRGVVAADPLMRRLQRKTLHQSRSGAGGEGTTSPDQSAASTRHWALRHRAEVSLAGWDVLRDQLGIVVEAVSGRFVDRALAGTASSSRFRLTRDTVSPVRCWEEAELPLALGTVVAARYVLPSPIQMQCIPMALRGFDVLGVAETGSGKTACYLIPALAEILLRCPRLEGDEELVSRGPFALCIVPTRELAEQVMREAVRFTGAADTDADGAGGSSAHGNGTGRVFSTAELNALESAEQVSDAPWVDQAPVTDAMPRNVLSELRIVKVVGGESADAQYDALAQGAHLVVGTVGQLQYLLDNRLMSVGNTRFVAIDEVDRMVEESGTDSLVAVLERCPLPRQTILFTATLSAGCEAIATKYLSPQGYFTVKTPYRFESITQCFEVVPSTVEVAAASSAPAGVPREKDAEPPLLSSCGAHWAVHPAKLSRLLTWLVYCPPPIVVFVNEKRVCDALEAALRVESQRLAEALASFPAETVLSEIPPPLEKWLTTRRQPVVKATRQPRLETLTSVTVLHSDLSQNERRRLVEQFRRGQRLVLLTTDLLARGLDVPGINLVVNYDLPQPFMGHALSRALPQARPAEMSEDAVWKYVHRIGRTGRGGASGIAVSFVCLKPRALEHAASSSAHRRVSAGDVGKVVADEALPLRRVALREVLDAHAEEFSSCDSDTGDEDDSGVEGNGDRPQVAGSPESRRAGKRAREHGSLGGSDSDSANGTPARRQRSASQRFPEDDAILKPLWEFLVKCAEANEVPRGAITLQQGGYAMISVPPALAALMAQRSSTSAFGSIVL